MRLGGLLVVIPVLLTWDVCVRADDATWLEVNFAGPPSREVMVSRHGSLRWVDMLGDRRLREGQAIETVAFSPDGTWFVSGSKTGTLKLWETKTGREIRTLTGRPLHVARVAVSRDGTRIFAAYLDGFDVWDAAQGTRLVKVSDPCPGATGVVFDLSPDDTWAVFGRSRDGPKGPDLSVWDTGTGKRTRTLRGHSGTLGVVAVSPTGTRVVSGGDGLPPRMRVWNAETGAYVGSIGEAWVSHLAFGPDGSWVMSLTYGRGESALEIHELQSGRLLRSVRSPDTLQDGPLALSPDGAWAVWGTWDGTMRIVETATGKSLRRFGGHTAHLSDLAVSPDGQTIVCAHEDGTLQLWDAGRGELRPVTPRPQPALSCLAVSPNGAWAVAGSGEGSLRFWEMKTRAVRTLTGHDGVVVSVAVSPDGQRVYSGAEDGLRARDASSGRQIWHVPARKFSRKEIAAMVPRRDWMAVYLAMIKYRNKVHRIAVAPSGRWLAAGHLDGTVAIHDAVTGAHQRTLGRPAESFFAAIAVSPDDSWLAVNSSLDTSSELEIWDTATGKLRRTIRRPTDNIGPVAVDPGGAWVVSASSGKELTIWNVASGERMHTLSGHKAPVMALGVSEDGKWIVSGARDALIVWDSATGKQLDRIRVDGGTVSDLVVREDRIWASLTGGTINVYQREPPSR